MEPVQESTNLRILQPNKNGERSIIGVRIQGTHRSMNPAEWRTCALLNTQPCELTVERVCCQHETRQRVSRLEMHLVYFKQKLVCSKSAMKKHQGQKKVEVTEGKNLQQ